MQTKRRIPCSERKPGLSSAFPLLNCIRVKLIYASSPWSVIRFSPSAAEVARASHFSFSGWPACPFTQMNFTWWGSFAFNRRFQRSIFLTGPLFPLFHPFATQLSIQCWLNASVRYLESEYNSTWHGLFNAYSPTIAAISSIRLLVVRTYPPDIVFS